MKILLVSLLDIQGEQRGSQSRGSMKFRDATWTPINFWEESQQNWAVIVAVAMQFEFIWRREKSARDSLS